MYFYNFRYYFLEVSNKFAANFWGKRGPESLDTSLELGEVSGLVFYSEIVLEAMPN